MRERILGIVVICLVGVTSAFATEAVGVRLGYFPNVTHAQALYARATGAFEKSLGARINWTAFNAGPTAIESLFADAVDATFVGPSPTVNGFIKSRGEKFVIVSGSASGGAGMVVREDAGIHDAGDFGGRVIATPQLGNTQDIAARVWFAEKGYKLKEKGGTVALVPLSNPDQLNMLRKKQIDGAWTVEPWISGLEIEGGARPFLDERSLWPDGRFVTTHLVVSKAFLAHEPNSVRALLLSLIDVTLKINADKKAAAKVINEQLKTETGKALKQEVLDRAMGRVEFTWDPIAESLKKSADAAHQVGFLRAEPRLEGIYSLGILNEILKEKGLPVVADLRKPAQ